MRLAPRYMAGMQSARFPEGLAFLKMHGAGNDFVIIDSRGRSPVVSAPLARAIGDRHRGVGYDQLAEILDADDADLRLDFWNADGSTAGACGNATRCVARLIMDETGKNSLTIRTARGVLQAQRRAGGTVWVNMGPPLLDWQDIPLAHSADPVHLPLEDDPAAVGMGNPHCIYFVEDAEAVDVAGRGSRIEHDPLFPQATNVEFASLTAPGEIRMRVWERGTGVTLACGSGACAVAVAARLRGLVEDRVRIRADGGWLEIDQRDDGVWMTGPTALVFAGTLGPDIMDGASDGQ